MVLELRRLTLLEDI